MSSPPVVSSEGPSSGLVSPQPADSVVMPSDGPPKLTSDQPGGGRRLVPAAAPYPPPAALTGTDPDAPAPGTEPSPPGTAPSLPHSSPPPNSTPATPVDDDHLQQALQPAGPSFLARMDGQHHGEFTQSGASPQNQLPGRVGPSSAVPGEGSTPASKSAPFSCHLSGEGSTVASKSLSFKQKQGLTLQQSVHHPQGNQQYPSSPETTLTPPDNPHVPPPQDAALTNLSFSHGGPRVGEPRLTAVAQGGSSRGLPPTDRPPIYTALRALSKSWRARVQDAVGLDDAGSPKVTPLRSNVSFSACSRRMSMQSISTIGSKGGTTHHEDGGRAAIADRLADGLGRSSGKKMGHTVEEVQKQMRKRTGYDPSAITTAQLKAGAARRGSAAESIEMPLLDWLCELHIMWDFSKWDTAQHRDKMGRFFFCDFIQPREERLVEAGMACKPRTAIKHCGVPNHGKEELDECRMRKRCIAHPSTKGGVTCMIDNFQRVADRLLQDKGFGAKDAPQIAASHTHHSKSQVTPIDLPEISDSYGVNAIAEGIAVCYAYTYQIYGPAEDVDESQLIDWAPGRSRPTQLYSAATRCLRALGDASNQLAKEWENMYKQAVQILIPFIWKLDRFILALPHKPRMVYRGISERVAEAYEVDQLLPWASHNSTTSTRDVAWDFIQFQSSKSEEIVPSGTFFCILVKSAVSIKKFSWIPGEDEFLLPTLSVFKVASKASPSLQQMLQTTHDICCLYQVDERDRSSGDTVWDRQDTLAKKRECQEVVDTRVMALRESALIFGPFLRDFIPVTVEQSVVSNQLMRRRQSRAARRESQGPVSLEPKKGTLENFLNTFLADRDACAQGSPRNSLSPRAAAAQLGAHDCGGSISLRPAGCSERVAVLIGASGMGKTSACLWMVHHISERLIEFRVKSADALGIAWGKGTSRIKNVAQDSPLMLSDAGAESLIGRCVTKVTVGSGEHEVTTAEEITNLVSKSTGNKEFNIAFTTARVIGGAPYIAVFISLPSVPMLLEHRDVRDKDAAPLVDHIMKQLNIVNASQLDELKERHVVLVLDSLEECVGRHDVLRYQTVLQLGGLNLDEWKNLRVIISVRRELLEQKRGLCGGWQLEHRHIASDCLVWQIQPFQPSEINRYSERVVSHAIRDLAAELIPLNVLQPDIERKLRRMSCPPPSIDDAKLLQEEVRGLLEQSGSKQKAAMECIRKEHGMRCQHNMLKRIKHAIKMVHHRDVKRDELLAADGDRRRTHRMSAPDLYTCKDKPKSEDDKGSGLLDVAFVMTMVVCAGHLVVEKFDLALAQDVETRLTKNVRGEVYAAWIRQRIRWRLPRLSALHDRNSAFYSKEFAVMDEDERIDCVAAFCRDLATSMLEMPRTADLITRVHRQINVGHVIEQQLGSLPKKYNRILMLGAPLRMESERRDDALVSFRHATVHDHFIAEKLLHAYNATKRSVLQSVSFAVESGVPRIYPAQVYPEFVRGLQEQEQGVMKRLCDETVHKIAIVPESSFPVMHEMIRDTLDTNEDAAQHWSGVKNWIAVMHWGGTVALLASIVFLVYGTADELIMSNWHSTGTWGGTTIGCIVELVAAAAQVSANTLQWLRRVVWGILGVIALAVIPVALMWCSARDDLEKYYGRCTKDCHWDQSIWHLIVATLTIFIMAQGSQYLLISGLAFLRVFRWESRRQRNLLLATLATLSAYNIALISIKLTRWDLSIDKCYSNLAGFVGFSWVLVGSYNYVQAPPLPATKDSIISATAVTVATKHSSIAAALVVVAVNDKRKWFREWNREATAEMIRKTAELAHEQHSPSKALVS